MGEEDEDEDEEDVVVDVWDVLENLAFTLGLAWVLVVLGGGE